MTITMITTAPGKIILTIMITGKNSERKENSTKTSMSRKKDKNIFPRNYMETEDLICTRDERCKEQEEKKDKIFHFSPV